MQNVSSKQHSRQTEGNYLASLCSKFISHLSPLLLTTRACGLPAPCPPSTTDIPSHSLSFGFLQAAEAFRWWWKPRGAKRSANWLVHTSLPLQFALEPANLPHLCPAPHPQDQQSAHNQGHVCSAELFLRVSGLSTFSPTSQFRNKTQGRMR